MRSAKVALRSSAATVTSQGMVIFDRPTLFFALALSLSVLGVYVFTLSNNYSPDSMAFAVLATRGQLTEPLFFQAEHLLYPFIGWLWYQLWVFFGYKQGALAPMQILNAIGGATGVGFFFFSLRLLLGTSRDAMLVSISSALLLAGTYGYWYHSTEAEDQIISNALVIGAFLLLVLRMRETKQDGRSLSTLKVDRFQSMAAKVARSRAFLALIVGLAIIAHATAVLFLPALLLGFWLKERDARSVVVLLAEVVGLVGAAFVVVGGLIHGFWSPGEYFSWLLSAPSTGVWGRLSLRNLWTGAQAMANAIVFLQGGPSFKALLNGISLRQNALGALLFLAVWALVALVAAYLVYYRRRLVEQRGVMLVCLVWFALFGLFNLYWAPEDIQFWIALAPPLIVGLSMVHLDLVAVMKYREQLLNGVFLLGLTIVVVVNLVTAVIPRANMATNAGLYKTVCLEHASSPNDLIITPGWDWASSYVPYFTKRHLLSIVDTYLLSAGGDQTTLFRLIDERMAETAARGGKVYVVRLFSLDQNDSAWFKRTTGLIADDFPFKRKQAWECSGEIVWEVVRQ